MTNYEPWIGDRVRFNLAARRNNFHDSKADGRKRFTVQAILPYGDCVLDDGQTWNKCWLEEVPHD